MKKTGHPQIHEINARCVCGNVVSTISTNPTLDIDICSNCHPFFTGQQKFIDTAGRIEKFEKRYKNIKK
jgi:large subunit ribosomal protein L31